MSAIDQAETIVAELARAVAAGDLPRARELDASLGAAVTALIGELASAPAEHRLAAAARLEAVNQTHLDALKTLLRSRDETLAELSGAVQGRRAAASYLDSAAE